MLFPPLDGHVANRLGGVRVPYHVRLPCPVRYLPFGKPIVLYFTPGADVNDYSRAPDRQVLVQLQADVVSWGK